jgi:hypothetical protein
MFKYYRPFSNYLVSALAKSRAAIRLVRTMAGDSRNLQQTWLDTASNSGCLHVFYCSFAQTVVFSTKKVLKCMPSVAKVFLKRWHVFNTFSVFWAKLQ